ncbi:hypothetical protein PN462_03885 [Spirulina sp. CS-785/01]|uniref:hypothetical protein n=1 Tax=Spirulina sp. CS-785/01 TaxID=3021716 RepID=UPI0023310A3B|nr:hypothetical protein [Spirulina sp. CS-785/01]MDB9312232.1 hypothetical protein [Spirulina sp. CS-785/01]
MKGQIVTKFILWFSLGLLIIGLSPFIPPQQHPVFAQRYVRPADAATRVYELLPDFPKENDYRLRETGEVDEDSTLISRLISYHLYVKNRPAIFRFDWKLTLSDYMGFHERVSPTSYPNQLNLEENPLEGDRKVIDSLTRQERNELIAALVQVFNPDAADATPEQPPESPQPTETRPPSPPTITPPREPQPGDAELLK